MVQRTQLLKFIAPLIFLAGLVSVGYLAFTLQRQDTQPVAGELAADKGYGVTIDLTQYNESELETTLQEIQATGLIWLRQPINWADIEPEANQFEWRTIDRIIEAVATTNQSIENEFDRLKLVVVLQTTPEWARPDETTRTTPPTQYSDFGRFAQAIAHRYGNQVDFYQIWHEPNLSVNWGDTFVEPTAYANLLREAALNIRGADSQAHILTGALAATLEDGPLNLNEVSYLDQLYQAQAQQWFDIVATQPYGLWTKPLDAPDIATLNFRRTSLVREVMQNHGDLNTPIWATAFGWVTLPRDWAGQPSPWSYDQSDVQAPRTAEAINHARQNWPWLGPMFSARWDTIGLAGDDPARGFALQDVPEIAEVFERAATNTKVASVGQYPANHPSGQYSEGWRFAQNRADIPQDEAGQLIIPFEGTRLDLHLERGPFRGYLWVTIDDQPANTLPQDGRGQSYVVLYDPLHEVDQVTLAQNLAPGQHIAVIEADGGWGQWAVTGWTVSNTADAAFSQQLLVVVMLATVLSGAVTLWLFSSLIGTLINYIWQIINQVGNLYASIGEKAHIVCTFGLAAGIFFLPGIGALLLLPFLALAILFRPDVGLMLVTFTIFLFELPIRLPIGSFSPVELALALTLIGFTWQKLLSVIHMLSTSDKIRIQLLLPQSVKATDLATISLVILALLATFNANQFAVSLREWRIVILESVIFYGLVRLGVDYGPQPKDAQRWICRLVDTFVAGALLQAIFALYLYFFTDQTINAEGVRRALGLVGGSPNNLALILDRAWPILLAIALFGQNQIRRWIYGIGLGLVTFVLYLTFSKGALLLGLPAGLIGMILLFGWHFYRQNWGRLVAYLGGGLTLLGLILIPFSQTQRFRATFNFDDGSTSFFRLKLWQSSWSMLKENPLLGVGLDNFLYEYRTRYILPEAWQEPNLNHPHNLFLDFGTRLGLGGIGILLWLQIAFWRNAWQVYHTQFNPLLLGLMGSMLIFLSHGLVDNSYFLVDLAFAFFLTVGIVQRWYETSEM